MYTHLQVERLRLHTSNQKQPRRILTQTQTHTQKSLYTQPHTMLGSHAALLQQTAANDQQPQPPPVDLTSFTLPKPPQNGGGTTSQQPTSLSSVIETYAQVEKSCESPENFRML